MSKMLLVLAAVIVCVASSACGNNSTEPLLLRPGKITELKQNPFRIVVESPECPLWLNVDAATDIRTVNSAGQESAGAIGDLVVGKSVDVWIDNGVYSSVCPQQAIARKIVVREAIAIRQILDSNTLPKRY